ncbi:type II toxin-antitoxin system VapB family antitoxin [Microbacterium ulmi]|uniref:Type II toxin-antitoxin system VapB family antitoxin n=1 Tax=Microbacterium ulmi TaxID=179095 RepID=A0A7Y2M239_9MICO|nr:type II toxin-antitoxin system VapB family antitoxin [Microbacterium ulmi]NII69532.1 Arc/MetJ family transcription regulator [Microbacterium ulmi]NNH05075.1 type II toxin-antitoxin system VapB family antitoxin [Microbacterium ulmi]
MGKTLIDIDDTVLARAQALSGIATKKGVVAAALEGVVRRLEVDNYAEFVTSGAVDDLSDPEVVRSAQR